MAIKSIKFDLKRTRVVVTVITNSGTYKKSFPSTLSLVDILRMHFDYLESWPKI